MKNSNNLEQINDISDLEEKMESEIENEEESNIEESNIEEEGVIETEKVLEKEEFVEEEATEEEEEEVKETETEEGETEEGEEIDFTEILNKYGLEDGKIKFEDSDEPVDFESLNLEDQTYVLKQLLVNASQEEEKEEIKSSESSESSLSESEADFLNTLRESGMTMEDYIVSLAPQTVMSDEDSVSEYDEETIFKYDFLMNLPDEDRNAMEESEIQDLLTSELELAVQSNTFNSRMNKLKERYVADELKQIEQNNLQKNQEQEKELENTRKEFVNKTANINEIGAFSIDDNIKEDLYSKILEQDSNGLSEFDKLVQSNPETAFKAVYYAFYGEQNEESLVRGFQDEIKKRVSEATKTAVQGFPSKPVISDRSSNTNMSNRVEGVATTFKTIDSLNNLKSIDDLHSEM